ncbi:MAG TPA: flagellar basal body P-ring formation chaperone FlgA [Bryobacteraceae bacterium]|jgi:flagella basal body P-ring formation protein FlgA|nr:flagellar basal body P-ring formation chaperone FlgA [Bryobacteraceae bacterium]
MRKLLLLATVSATVSMSASAACVPVTGSRILARDLARADAQYAALPSTLVAGFNAEPGMTRTFTGAELQRLAKTNGIEISNPASLCFELPMQHLKPEDVTVAMQSVLPREASLKIIQIQSATVPAGQLEFPLNNLDSTGLWRGDIKYAEGKEAPVWARVAVTANYTAVVAATDLPAGAAIPVSALRIEQRIGPLQHEPAAASIADVAGRAPKRNLKAGMLVLASVLTTAPAVQRGDSVRVDVHSGPARLHFEAIVENPASTGSLVDLRNPANGKVFKARLDTPSTATVELK